MWFFKSKEKEYVKSERLKFLEGLCKQHPNPKIELDNNPYMADRHIFRLTFPDVNVTMTFHIKQKEWSIDIWNKDTGMLYFYVYRSGEKETLNAFESTLFIANKYDLHSKVDTLLAKEEYEKNEKQKAIENIKNKYLVNNA